MAVVAIARGVDVGVDVEHIRPIDYEPLLDDVCQATERGGVSDHTSFFRLWTRKEAVLKATGEGLAVPLRDVLLSPADTPPRLLRYPDRPGLCMTISDLDVAGDFAAAAAIVGAPLGKFHVRDGSDLLC